jgi:hypothetical protein
MARYIRFTVTPTDGSPYTQWLNADVVNRTVNNNFNAASAGTARYIIGSQSAMKSFGATSPNNRGNVFATPISTDGAIQVISSAATWWSDALSKLEETAPQIMFIDAEGSPACGISALESVTPAVPTP